MGGRRKLLGYAVGAAALLALVSAVDGDGFRRYLRLEREAKALAEANASLREENRRYRDELEALRTSPRALERAAREELGFIQPGEVVFNLE